MSTITITIDTGNDAFADGNEAAEVARILAELAARIARADSPRAREYLYDYNGNRVGRVSVKGEAP